MQRNLYSFSQTLLIMKFTGIFLLMAAMSMAAIGYTQQVSLRMQKAPLAEVLKAIKKQTGYEILYSNRMLEKVPPISVQFTHVPLEIALEACFAGSPLSYRIVEKTIIVKQKPIGRMVDPVDNAPLPPLKIRVIDSLGNPLAGASITLKEKKGIGSTTNANGEFTLDVTEGDVIEVSYIGYEPQIIRMTETLLRQQTMIVPMKMGVNDMDNLGVVVNTGYQSLPKERATGSFGRISGEEIQKKATPNVIDRIEGMVSGVLVNISQTDAGLLNSSSRTNFTVRGRNTINANQSPLVVVDGFPTELDLRFINSADIENITILKDAAAASIWGVRAANGVIVIETKKGAKNKGWKVDYSTSLSTTAKPRLDYQPMLSAPEQIDFEQELIDKNVLYNPFTQVNPPPTTLAADIIFRAQQGLITQEQKEAQLNELRTRDYKEQYERYLLQQPFNQIHSISLSGGERNSKTYLSASYTGERPNAVADLARRVTFDASHTVSFLKKVTFFSKFNVAMVKENRNGYGIGPLMPGINTYMPYDQLVDENGNRIQRSRSYYSTKEAELVSKGYLPWGFNYLNEMENRDNTNRDNTYRMNFGLNYKILEGLSASVQYMLEKRFLKTRNYANSNTHYARNLINNATSIGANGALVYGYPKGGVLVESQTDLNHYNIRGQLNFNRNFHQVNQIDALAGGEIREELTTSFGNIRYGYNDRDLTSEPVAYGTQYRAAVTNSLIRLNDPSFNTYIQNRYISYYANASYTYKSKYTVSGSARIDDSNLFGADEKYRATPLWSVGGVWKLHRESWFGATWVNLLNPRVTYGINGNVDKTTSPFLIATIGGNDFLLGQTYANISNPSNPLLRWEKTATFNVGVDFSLFNNRLDGSLDWYMKKNTDLLGPAVLNPTLGFTQATINTADLKGRGVDLTLNGRIIDTRRVGWDSRLTFSYNTNEVVKTDLQQTAVNYYLTQTNPIIGESLDRLYSYRWSGLDKNGQPLVYDETGKPVPVTTRVSNKDALVYSGRTVPSFFGGWTNTFRYSNLELSVLLTYKMGYVYRKPSGGNYYSYTTQKRLHKDVANRWQRAGDEAFTNIPGVPVQSQINSPQRYLLSDLLVRRGDHVRLREVILTYTFPAAVFGKIFIKGLQLGLQARNLGILTYEGEKMDPDFIPSEGQLNLPPSASVIGSVRVNF